MVAIGGMPATEQDGAATGHGGSLPGRIAAAVGARLPERKETAGGGSQALVCRKLLWVSIIGIRVAGTQAHSRESFRPGACEAGQTSAVIPMRHVSPQEAAAVLSKPKPMWNERQHKIIAFLKRTPDFVRMRHLVLSFRSILRRGRVDTLKRWVWTYSQIFSELTRSPEGSKPAPRALR
jgi:hypothetical protein